MKEFIKNRENRISVIFFLVTMITAMSPLVSRYCINGHDIEYHLLRIESLKEGILIGHPFLKVNTLFFGGAGYASSLFYSDIFMHIPALLRVFHVNIGTSFHIYTAVIFVLCYLSTYYCVWKMSLSKFAGTVAAILMTLCPYHMDDMVVRTACGENTAFIFLPLAIYGIFNVLYEEMDKPWVFGLGFAGLILAHPATCILMTCFGIVAFLINIRTFTKEPRLFVKMCVVACLAALVTAYQWMPMLEQFASAKFYVSNNWTDLLDASVGFADIASSTFPCMGFLLFAFAFPRLFLTKKDYPILAYVDYMMILAIVFAIGTTNIMPWERVARYFGFLQFPWRMFIMSSALLAMADAIVIRLFVDRIGDEKRVIASDITLIVVAAFMIQFAINHQSENSMGYYDYSDDYYSYKPFTADVIAGEWLPESVTNVGELIDQSEKMVFDDGTDADFTRQGAKIVSKIDTAHDHVDVPFIFYKGYSAVIKDANGNKTKLRVTDEGENGMCRVSLSQMTGELTVKYSGTVVQYISLILSHLFLLLIFDFWYLKNKYKKKLKMRAAKAGANLGKIAGFVIFAILSCELCACSAIELKSTAKNIEGYTDPDAMIDYLKDKNREDEGSESVEEEPVKVNFSRRGYDEDGKSYAVMIDESSGEQVISVISLEEAEKYSSEEHLTEKGLYEKLLDEEVKEIHDRYRTDSLKDRIMHETDALLCLEVFPSCASRNGVGKLAEELADDILNIPGDMLAQTIDKYNCAAVIAKAAYVIPEWKMAKEATKISEMYFKEAESIADTEGEPVASRLWAAAELYRLTGQKTYRSVVDAIAMDVITEGFTYEEPGYIGLFAYLMSPYPTNYNVCTNMMDVVFSKANDLIKSPIDTVFYDARVDDGTAKRDEKTATEMLDEALLVTMTNYVSVSVEYIGFVENRLNYIYGANLSGIDFTDDDNALCDAPKMFVLAGLCKM